MILLRLRLGCGCIGSVPGSIVFVVRLKSECFMLSYPFCKCGLHAGALNKWGPNMIFGFCRCECHAKTKRKKRYHYLCQNYNFVGMLLCSFFIFIFLKIMLLLFSFLFFLLHSHVVICELGLRYQIF